MNMFSGGSKSRGRNGGSLDPFRPEPNGEVLLTPLKILDLAGSPFTMNSSSNTLGPRTDSRASS